MLSTWIGERLKKAIEYDEKLTAYKSVVETKSQQVKGRDSGIKVVSTYTLQTSGAQEALISSAGRENLTKEQRHDLGELLRLSHELIPSKEESGSLAD